eukprot:CAMPEP_0184305606 /NCGR_PEP_ID=MMETSP1049-20130417/14842_1 /TAXON_ID=77928 /ORGANISM="Proteomonas sulcata, Strain CCMP704" /LENGTH=94 /DNA_ID=CAMNT_0026617709 /DNA_START=8 /DNA_END=292 /DNA_ORIENTATION=+
MEGSAHDLKPTELPAGITPKQVLRTTPHNHYMPNQNQAKHCYMKYNEFFRCEKVKGEGAKECFHLKQSFFAMCPNEWVEKWDEQRAAGNFPGPL